MSRDVHQGVTPPLSDAVQECCNVTDFLFQTICFCPVCLAAPSPSPPWGADDRVAPEGFFMPSLSLSLPCGPSVQFPQLDLERLENTLMAFASSTTSHPHRGRRDPGRGGYSGVRCARARRGGVGLGKKAQGGGPGCSPLRPHPASVAEVPMTDSNTLFQKHKS